MDASLSFRELTKAKCSHHEYGISIVAIHDRASMITIAFQPEHAAAAVILADTLNGLIAKRDAPIHMSAGAASAIAIAALSSQVASEGE